MNDNILAFAPRAEYDRIRWERISTELQTSVAQSAATELPQLTSGELYSILYAETAERCKLLVRFYKHSGKWNTECESQMTKIVKSFQTLCETLAHSTVHQAK